MNCVETGISNGKVEKNIYTYDILRVIATLLVIVSHCSYYNIITKYGGINYGEKLNFVSRDTVVHMIFSHLVRFIYTFHMPLFIGLAGSLFYIQVKNNKFKCINTLIVNKASRLLTPFLLITLIYSVPIKYISGYFKNSNNLFKDIVVGQVLIQGNTYLWFLPTLFLCFVFIYISEKYIHISSKYKIIILIGLNILSYIVPVMIIKYVFQYLIWFYFGFLFEPIREKINYKLEKHKKLWIIVLIGTITLYIVSNINLFESSFFFKFLYKIIMIFMGIMGCFLMYIISFRISKKNIFKGLIFRELLITSFGLYLYSDPINYLVLFVIYKLSNLSIFTSEIGASIIILIRFITTLFIAFIITKVFKKFKIKYIT